MRPNTDQWYTNHAAPFARIGTLCLTTKHMAWSLSRYSLAWTDDTTPRTDKPVRFAFFPVVGTIGEDGWYADAFYSLVRA